jgi:hypothetical protein
MITDTEKEIIEAVDKVNDDFYKRYKKLDHNDRFKDWFSVMPVVSITFAGYYTLINIHTSSERFPLEIPIWCSEDDDRNFDEDKNEYEDWYKFIKRKFSDFKKEIKTIKL